jgi:hypothetical protein
MAAVTDRHSSYIVVLDHDVREDDAEQTLSALRQIRGVLTVEPVVSDYEQHVAESRATRSMREKLYDFMKEWKP